MKTLVVNRNVIASIFAVMLLIYGLQGISYGQGNPPTVTPGETNTSLVVRFQITLDEGVDENAYQIQVRRKATQGEWISKCVVIKRGIRHATAGDPDVFASAIYISAIIFHFGDWSDDTFDIDGIFTDLELGTTYEARYRDTNLSECAQNPPAPDPWSGIGEGTTHVVAPTRAEFFDDNLAEKVRSKLGLDIVGGHIDLLKIPQASLAKLTELELGDAEITDLRGLDHAILLTNLDLSDNQISNITPLAQLLQLTDLDLRRNQISDITALAQLTQLIELRLQNNQISDISPLARLPSLKWLSLSSNQISDVTPLTTFASVDSLRHLFLSGNPITDTSPVRKIKREAPDLSLTIDKPVILTDPGSGPDLYVIADRNILQVNLDRINVQQISPQSLIIYGIAIDVIGSKIYWTTREDIQRANLDGTNVQDVITGLDEPEDIALDVSGGKIYWTEESAARIRRANLDGTNVQDVVTGLYRPYGIALDVLGGKIYWMEEDDHRIQRANLDGTNVQDVVTGLDEPEDIALDVSGGKIYWTEPSEDRIQRANLDGSDVHVIAIGVYGPTAIALHTGETSVPQVEDAEITEPTVLKEDVNGDGTVNILDLILIASNLGQMGQNKADVNGDGTVNIQDLVLVAGALGTSDAAPSLHPQSLEMFTAADVKLWLSQAQHLSLTDATSQRGILFLEQLFAALIPIENALLANYPNPFNPETWIPYQLAHAADVTLTIYDTQGTLVRQLDLRYQQAGYYTNKTRAAYWDGRNHLGELVGSGLYFYQLRAGDYSTLRKMVILK